MRSCQPSWSSSNMAQSRPRPRGSAESSRAPTRRCLAVRVGVVVVHGAERDARVHHARRAFAEAEEEPLVGDEGGQHRERGGDDGGPAGGRVSGAGVEDEDEDQEAGEAERCVDQRGHDAVFERRGFDGRVLLPRPAFCGAAAARVWDCRGGWRTSRALRWRPRWGGGRCSRARLRRCATDPAAARHRAADPRPDAGALCAWLPAHAGTR